MMRLSVDIITDFMAFAPHEVWKRLQNSHLELLGDDVVGELGENECRLASVEDKLRSASKRHFGLSVSGGEIQYGHINNYAHSLIWVQNLVRDMADADLWVEPFCSASEFVQAWVYEPDYIRWQNAEDPLVYQAAGKSWQGLPMKSNGLPFPLEQTVIDTSQNPGRRVLRKGYVEAVGAIMWLGSAFLNRVGLSVAELRSESWLDIEELSSGALKIKVMDEVFTTAEADQEKLQNGLRSLLFRSVTA